MAFGRQLLLANLLRDGGAEKSSSARGKLEYGSVASSNGINLYVHLLPWPIIGSN